LGIGGDLRRDDDLQETRFGFQAAWQPQQNVQGGLSARCVRNLRSFLTENFSRKLSVAEMAAVCGLSTSHFARAFSRTFGKSPHQYVLDLRLDHAERLLSDGRMSIADVAHQCGFASQSHLTTMMKKHRDMTPMQAQAGALTFRSRA
jgi:AraC-like DNA-binding protein